MKNKKHKQQNTKVLNVLMHFKSKVPSFVKLINSLQMMKALSTLNLTFLSKSLKNLENLLKLKKNNGVRYNQRQNEHFNFRTKRKQCLLLNFQQIRNLLQNQIVLQKSNLTKNWLHQLENWFQELILKIYYQKFRERKYQQKCLWINLEAYKRKSMWASNNKSQK